ncbi:MAG: NDP-sugar synthase [Erysipelotrichaceae bacterium]
MREPTLVILAAGLGSRYGGLKQIDSISENGESIIDFSIYDAYQAGFRKLVLIIRKEHEALFDEHIANKLRPFMEVTYAYQDIKDLPEGFNLTTARTKPWGTTQALLAARSVIDGPFMVINADDFYGKQSYQIMYDFLTTEVKQAHYGMVSYQLSKTLTDNGSVTRAICKKDDDGNLTEIVEVPKIIRKQNKPHIVNDDGSTIEVEDSLCSMNFWGFDESIFPLLQEDFCNFLKENINSDKNEQVLPTSIANLVNQGKVKVKIMATDSQWFGVTYPQDKEGVIAKIAQYKEDDIYPFDLWSVD